jgi:hypothetical protein
MRKFEKVLNNIVFDGENVCDGSATVSFEEIVPKQNGFYFLKIKSSCIEKTDTNETYKQSVKTYNDLWLDVHVHTGKLFPELQVPGTTLEALVRKTLCKIFVFYQIEISFKPKEYVGNQTITLKT